MNPLISVIMPVFNTEKYLNEAIESVLNQSISDFEFIIIDDASTDGSIEIINSYKDPRIVFIKNKINQGYVFGLNYGLSIAKGEFIARMDSDDISYPNRFLEQMNILQSKKEIGVCGSYVRFIGSGSGFWKPPTLDHEIKAGLINGSTFCHPSVMIRKKILDSHKIQYSIDYYLAEDYYMWLELSKHTSFYNIPKILLDYRSTETQVSFRHQNKQQCLKKEIQIMSLLLLDELYYDELESLLANKLTFDSAFLLIERLRISNSKKNLYDQNSFTQELSIMLLKLLVRRKSRKHLITLLFSRYSKFLTIRMKLGLIKKLIYWKIH